MKGITFRTMGDGYVHYFTIAIICLILSSCGAGGGGSDNGSSGNGSVTFELAMQDSDPAGVNIQRQISGPPVSGDGIDCNYHDIGVFMGEIFDENNQLIADGGPWDCEDHQGSIEGVKAGKERIVAIYGYDPEDFLAFRGESPPFEVIADRSNEAGSISLFQCIDPSRLGKLVRHSIELKEDTHKTITYVTDNFEPEFFIGKTGDRYKREVICEPDPKTRNGVVESDTETAVITYTPDSDYFGPDTFTCRIIGKGDRDQDDVTIEEMLLEVTVAPTPDAPVALSDLWQVPEDEFLKDQELLASDKDGDALTYSIVSNVTRGTLTTDKLPAVDYKPDPDYCGNDQFTFRANDGQSDSNDATVEIVIDCRPDPPKAIDIPVVLSEDSGKSPIVLLAEDPDGDPLSYTLVSNPVHGLLSGTAPTLEYEPDPDYFGNDSFQFMANDGTFDSNPATVLIRINPVDDPPVAKDDSFATNEDTPINGNVLNDNGNGEDTDIDGPSLTVFSVNGSPGNVGAEMELSSGAILTISADGTFSYDPRPSSLFNEMPDSQSLTEPNAVYYQLTGSTTQTAVEIIVTGRNDPPVAGNDSFDGNEDQLVTGDLFSNDSDPDTGFQVTRVNGSADDVGRSIELDSGALLTVRADGSFSYDADASQRFNALPEGGIDFDSFTYEISDGIASALATVSATISGVNDAPEAVADSYVIYTHARVAAGQDKAIPVVVDAYFDDFAARKPPPIGQRPDRPAWIDPTISDFVENRETISGPTVSGTNFLRLVESTTNDSSVYFDIGTSFSYGEFRVSMDLLLEGPENYQILFQHGSGTGSDTADRRLAAVRFLRDGSIVFDPVADAATAGYDPGKPIGIDVFFDLGHNTWDVYLDGRQVVTEQALEDGYLGRVRIGFGADTGAEPEGRMQLDSLRFAPVQQSVLVNDLDPEGDAMTVSLEQNVERGNLQLNSDGSFVYIPNAQFEDQDFFSYRASDGTAEGGPVKVIIAAAQPAAWRPPRLGNVSIPGQTRVLMHVSDSNAYVIRSDAEKTFAIFDVKDRTAPRLVTETFIEPGDDLHDLWYAGGYVFTAHRFGHVTMLDVKNPLEPVILDDYDTNYTHRGIMSVGKRLYVAEHSLFDALGGLRVFNISSDQLEPIGAYFGEIDGRDLAVSSDGFYAYQSTAHDDWGPHAIYAFSVLQPQEIFEVGRVPEIYGEEVLISPDDRNLFMSYRQWPNEPDTPLEGVKIYDLSADPRQPTEVGSIALIHARDLALDAERNLLYVQTYSDDPGLYVFDVSLPRYPWEIHFSPLTIKGDVGDLWYDRETLYTVELNPTEDVYELVVMGAHP